MDERFPLTSFFLRHAGAECVSTYASVLLCNGWLNCNKRTADEHDQCTEHPLTYISLP